MTVHLDPVQAKFIAQRRKRLSDYALYKPTIDTDIDIEGHRKNMEFFKIESEISKTWLKN